MKYVCIDNGAVAELISGRGYQSIDFQEGDRLIKSLEGEVTFIAKQGPIFFRQDEDGVFFTTSGNWKEKRYLVIDCETSQLFSQLRSTESLTSFQKLLRFCAKYWANGVYTHAEKFISGTSKVVLFPFPYSASSKFRIAIEREPWKERLTKRDMDGHFLLAYKSGCVGANSSVESADETNFRKVFNRLADVYTEISRLVEKLSGQEPGGQIRSTDLDESLGAYRPTHLAFESWVPLLTEKQRRFIHSNPSTPHRLQGPAGTGKTLTLMLKTVWTLREAERSSSSCHALLVTHSEATCETMKSALQTIDSNNYQSRPRGESDTTLSVQTLASLCASFLNQSISETEFIDRDAQDSKLLQQMYIEKAIQDARASEYSSFRPLLSEGFRSFFESQSDADMSSMFQHEISVLIKGRAGDSMDVYKNCPSLQYGLPVSNEADKGFVYTVFTRYQSELATSSQFDTDDVVISAIGQLDTPIWRRRRLRDGYDFIAIDESHLFNINELHVFHYFTREIGKFPISFTVDTAQAVGDRGWENHDGFDILTGGVGHNEEEETVVSAVFRSSPAITDFAHSILASGATLFTNFENTLLDSQSAFTQAEDRKAQPVEYIEYPDDNSMFDGAFTRASELRALTDCAISQVLITTLSNEILEHLREYVQRLNRPATFLERRGDFLHVKQAEKSGHMVFGHADLVGGLEFDVVLIVGVDKGRVPFEGEAADSNSRSYASYSAHNRLYVASTRAKYALSLSGVKSRGPSDLLRAAAIGGLIDGVSDTIG
tara:strand:- start:1537 stop:3855 length:2319 start_codon:yes stop_codon:yes gene_type:complete